MKLSQKEFDTLIKKADCVEWDLTGTIAFDISQQFYSIGFYGECKDGFSLVVDEYLKKVNNVWTECEPTEYQRLVMQSTIIDKRKELEEKESLENKEELEDNYENLGLNPSDFF
jgi:hypothetical protein